MASTPERPPTLHEHAADNLRFIREAMARAGTFTAVPGRGIVLVGSTALIAAWIAHTQPTPLRWMTVWLVELAIAEILGIGGIVLKARSTGLGLLAAPVRRFALAFIPPLVVGGLLTLVMWNGGDTTSIGPMWLLLYGAAVMTGGALSVRVVPFMGLTILLTGCAALVFSAAPVDLFMAIGFGLVQVAFGLRIARRYGG
ncbi:MAG: hypothetical protein WBX15_04195 [Thermoanaerobaculia bacterium]